MLVTAFSSNPEQPLRVYKPFLFPLLSFSPPIFIIFLICSFKSIPFGHNLLCFFKGTMHKEFQTVCLKTLEDCSLPWFSHNLAFLLLYTETLWTLNLCLCIFLLGLKLLTQNRLASIKWNLLQSITRMVKYTLSTTAWLNCLHYLDTVLMLRESRRLLTEYICMVFYNS